MGNRALKVGIMVILFFFVLLSVVSGMRTTYWLECLRMLEDPLNARKVAPGLYTSCLDHDRALYYVYQGKGKLPRSYVKALRVFCNGNRTKVHNYIVNGESD